MPNQALKGAFRKVAIRRERRVRLTRLERFADAVCSALLIADAKVSGW
jgi:hypothetical protein